MYPIRKIEINRAPNTGKLPFGRANDSFHQQIRYKEEFVITLPAGSTNVLVEEASAFVVGQKIALGYGSTYPIVANTVEQYEIATVTAVGKRSTQTYLAMEAPAGATSLQVISSSNLSAGDKIRLDVDSMGHGIETVTITQGGTAASQTNLSAPASAGCTRISLWRPYRSMGAAEGDQAVSGGKRGDCFTSVSDSVFHPWSTVVAPVVINTRAGRFPDGVGTDSNCNDFSLQAAASLSVASTAGATNIKVGSTDDFRPGQTVHIGSGADTETAVIATVGTAGVATMRTSTDP